SLLFARGLVPKISRAVHTPVQIGFDGGFGPPWLGLIFAGGNASRQSMMQGWRQVGRSACVAQRTHEVKRPSFRQNNVARTWAKPLLVLRRIHAREGAGD